MLFCCHFNIFYRKQPQKVNLTPRETSGKNIHKVIVFPHLSGGTIPHVKGITIRSLSGLAIVMLFFVVRLNSDLIGIVSRAILSERSESKDLYPPIHLNIFSVQLLSFCLIQGTTNPRDGHLQREEWDRYPFLF